MVSPARPVPQPDPRTTSPAPKTRTSPSPTTNYHPYSKPKTQLTPFLSHQSSPRAASPSTAGAAGTPPAASASGARPSSPPPPGGARTAIRRRAAADQKDKIANARPNSTRAAGAGGSSSTMLRLYTDESPGLKVDPVVVLVLSLVFIFSVVALHSESFFSFPVAFFSPYYLGGFGS